MIGKLTGRLDSVHEGGLILDVNGVGYLVSATTRAVAALPAGGIGSLYLETSVREDAITLYGFADAAERDWFRMLTGIQGVGPKVALNLLSVLSPGDLAAAIVGGDRGSLTRAPGVGPKLAIRLLSELREKVGGMPTGDAGIVMPAAMVAAGGTEGEAISALVNLGWRRPEAAAVVTRVRDRMGEGVDLGVLIRESLKEMAPR